MDLTQILSYQETDIKLRRLQRSIEGGEYGKALVLHKREFATAKKGIEDTEAAASEIVARYTEAAAAFDDSQKRVEKAVEDLAKADEANEQELLNILESLSARLSELEKRVAELRKRSEKAVADFTEAQKKGRQHKEAYAKAKEAFDANAAKYAGEIEALTAELGEKRKKVEKQLIEAYDQLVSERILPAFVPVQAAGKSYVCGGCGMQLAGAAHADLDKSGKCRCESCRRIIYKQ